MANAKPRLAVFGHYAKAELAPPLTPAELGQVAKGLSDVGSSIVTVSLRLGAKYSTMGAKTT